MGRLHTLKRLPQLGLGVRTERREVVGDAAREEEGRLQDEREARAQLVQADGGAVDAVDLDGPWDELECTIELECRGPGKAKGTGRGSREGRGAWAGAPSCGSLSRKSAASSDDLPAPVRPHTPTSEPGATAKETPRSAGARPGL